ncbi:MAG: hypothetical protein ACP5N2_05045 [Candidatus Nanoarchaeia archaeon]
MKKKGQAAMEFLMTYGWAIIVVLAAIAALAYFGVLSPSKLLPERTTFAAPLSNVDNAVIDLGDTNNIAVAFINNVGVSINVTGVGALEVSSSTQCDDAATTVQISADGATFAADLVVPNGDSFIVAWTCDTTGLSVESGDKFKADSASFSYMNMETMQTRKHTGSIDGKFQ